MAQTKYTDGSGIAEIWANIKNYVTAQLLAFVDLTSTQTISGAKTFTSTPAVKKDSAGDLLYLIDDTINTSNEDENGFPLTGHTNSLKIRGHATNMIPCMLTGQVFTNGDTSAELRAYKYKDISSGNSRAIISLRYIYNNNNGTVTFSNIGFIIPNVNNTTNLGSPSLQWNDTYTRHIIIDNDINIWSSVINKTSNSGSLSLRSGTNYADGASIGLYGKDYNSTIAGVATITAYGNSDYTILYIYPNGTMSVYNNSTNTTKNLALQEDVNALLNNKANSSHTHTISDITDFPTIPTKTSDLTNDSCIPLSGTNALGGNIIPSTNISYNLGSTNYRFSEGYFGNLWVGGLFGGLESGIDINYQVGANLILRGKNRSSEAGIFWLVADDGSNSTRMMGSPDGTLTWGSKNLAMQEDTVPRSGGAVITNYFLGRSVNTGSLMISGGTSWSSGGSLETFGSSHSSYAGQVRLQPALSNSNFRVMTLAPNGTWTWNGTACQITSDQRYKQQITEIDDKLLDAWEDVELVQFKYNDSVDTKGKSARLHTGYVVQQIDSACKSHGIDVSAYGLYCHEEYPEETREVEVEQTDGTKTKETKVIREANEHYSLRYTEALIVECKYLRRCIARLTTRIEELEKGNNNK